MTTTRMTARSFRARFHKLDEPVLVGDGIWFPKATADLLAIAEALGLPDVAGTYEGPIHMPNDQGHPFVGPITKADQAKGKSRKKR